METQVYFESDKTKVITHIQKIAPFLWFDDESEYAVNFYISIFRNSKVNFRSYYNEEGSKASGQPKGSLMTINFQLEGYEFTAINGGPAFKVSPVISFFVNCDSVEEIDFLWNRLTDSGKIMMEIDKYPFSERYGWVQDKFGISWQLILDRREQKITPCLMFSGDQHLKAEEAINFYTSIFKNSSIIQMEHYTKDMGGPIGAVVHCRFNLENTQFVAMDSHSNLPYNFNPAISMVIYCKTQQELDYYWDKLTQGGDESAQQCGWLQDKYGMSWQIVPESIDQMISSNDERKTNNFMKAMMQMKKLDILTLEKALE